MRTENPVELEIEVLVTDATEDDRDEATRNLLSELRETDVELAKLAQKGNAPRGSKGDPVTVGSIALVVLPAVLPKVVDAVQAWVSRGNNRTVKFRGKVGGKMIEFEGSSEELQKLINTLERGKKK